MFYLNNKQMSFNSKLFTIHNNAQQNFIDTPQYDTIEQWRNNDLNTSLHISHLNIQNTLTHCITSLPCLYITVCNARLCFKQTKTTNIQ